MEKSMTNGKAGVDFGELAAKYKAMLVMGQKGPSTLESVDESAADELDLSAAAVADRLRKMRLELERIVRNELGDDPKLHELVDRIVAKGDTALRLLGAGDDSKLAETNAFGDLEVVVRADGSRPSFMVKNDKPDRTTSPVGDWGELLNSQEEQLSQALNCVGRIDDPSVPGGFIGTGFLVQENLIVTNRHVLQALGAEAEDHTWTLRFGLAIDFGHEFRAIETARRRELSKVVYCGRDPISGRVIDHSRLDLALIELTPAGPDNKPASTLAIDIAPEWATPDEIVFIMGYPGRPQVGEYEPTLLEQLFRSTFGCKRLAPGRVTKSGALPSTAGFWGTSHDATTLGGNSGSCVVIMTHANAAVGLHYGGRRTEPRENWAHVLGRVLDASDGRTGETLRSVLGGFGVKLLDRLA
jgi:hypothetical protein